MADLNDEEDQQTGKTKNSQSVGNGKLEHGKKNCMDFLVLSSGIIYGYYSVILKVDEEEFGGHGALLLEGLFASVTLFLLSWILVYSLAHF